MNSATKITGVILAGGLARRMNQQEKGLACYQGRPLVSYAINALTPLVDNIIINANRHHELYQQFGLPVIADQTNDFAGPLAGILTAMYATDSETILVMPCDAPFMSSDCLEQLVLARAKTDADVAVASDHERLHPLFLAIHRRVISSLQHYLDNNQHKVQTWLAMQNMTVVKFDDANLFTNINTLAELSALEKLN